ncbi:MAG TPA: M81 family metallopeptidase [Thermomicrobiaceae bacterium]|nr:M81 family metallopeptidase [Thermomicrobiaceae bacterium]
MAIRIVTGGIAQETNTFQWEPTTLTDFQKGSSHVYRGDQILALDGTGTIYGGIVAEARKLGVELIPTTYAQAVPGGRVSREAFETFKAEILDGIRKAMPVDGVLLGIHGAMALEHNDDGEGPLITAVRELVGPEVPIVTPLDLHTNLSDEMMEEATAFVGYKEYPHIDTAETGARALQILVQTVRGEVTPTMAATHVPLIAPNQSMVTTWQSPLKTAIDRTREMERDPKVLAATVLGGFPFSDVPFTSVSTIVVTDNDPVLARQYADELARICWDLREDFTIHPTPIADAIAEAMAGEPGSVYVLADISDSGASGTAGDGTAVLKGLLAADAKSAAVAQIMDRAAVDACIAAGVGATVTLSVGGKHDTHHGEPVEVTGKVRLIHEGSFPILGPMGAGTWASRGRTVVLEIGGRDGIELQLTDLRGHPSDLNFFRAFGIEPTRRRILVLKSAAHFRAAFEPIATKVIEVDAPGISSPRLDTFDYRNLRRPIYPLDRDVEWSPGMGR